MFGYFRQIKARKARHQIMAALENLNSATVRLNLAITAALPLIGKPANEAAIQAAADSVNNSAQALETANAAAQAQTTVTTPAQS